MDRRHLQLTESFIADDLRQMQLAPNYNNWLYSIVKPHLGKRVIEVGAGIGNMTRFLLRDAEFVLAIEPNHACNLELQKLEHSPQQFETFEWTIEDSIEDYIRNLECDTVLCMNVIEHIHDDHQVMEKFKMYLPNGGRVILLVPAVPLAYGPIDKAVGHFRRYSKKSLQQLSEKSGMKIDSIKYSNFPGLMGWFYNAHITKIIQQNDNQIQVFNNLVPYIETVERIIPPPIGLSLVSVSYWDQ